MQAVSARGDAELRQLPRCSTLKAFDGLRD